MKVGGLNSISDLNDGEEQNILWGTYALEEWTTNKLTKQKQSLDA